MIEVLRSKFAQLDIENVIASNITINAESIRANSELLNNFDLIVASSVCSFLPDYVTTLCDLSLVMRPGAFFVQWDWMEDMPEERIRVAFSASGLINHGINQAFTMKQNGESMPVVMGIGRMQS